MDNSLWSGLIGVLVGSVISTAGTVWLASRKDKREDHLHNLREAAVLQQGTLILSDDLDHSTLPYKGKGGRAELGGMGS
jgi:hypothetical protein